ncbi:MAG: reverse transcriptase domain-containing protein, partial [Cyanobacteria bacterium J06582_2]
MPKWEEIAKDDWVVSVVRDGYQIPFLQPPPLSEKPISLTAYQKGSERWVALGREVDSLLAKDAIELITPTTPGFYARLFVVTKRTGGWRPVLDVSALNKYVALTKFKMESTKSVLASVQKGDWLTSLDLRDAYLHVPMHPDSRRFLRFMYAGNCYEFKVLPFGLSSAPQVFTRVMAQAGRWLHLQSVRILLYLDDWLVLSYSEAHARQCSAKTLRICLDLDIVVILPKSDLHPSRKATYLCLD